MLLFEAKRRLGQRFTDIDMGVYDLIRNMLYNDYSNVNGIFNLFKGLFTLDFQLMFSGITEFGSGLVFLGGLIGGMISVTIYIKKNNLSWYKVSDWVAPYLILGHAIGRLGYASEVSPWVLFLCSKYSTKFSTGSIINIDGYVLV